MYMFITWHKPNSQTCINLNIMYFLDFLHLCKGEFFLIDSRNHLISIIIHFLNSQPDCFFFLRGNSMCKMYYSILKLSYSHRYANISDYMRNCRKHLHIHLIADKRRTLKKNKKKIIFFFFGNTCLTIRAPLYIDNLHPYTDSHGLVHCSTDLSAVHFNIKLGHLCIKLSLIGWPWTVTLLLH